MSTVKISELPALPGGLNANTANSLFLGVDIPTGVTGRFTATQLAERLYANNVLNVGANPIVLPDVVAQFAGTSGAYIQTNLQNDAANGSSDYVATADIGTDTTHYIDMGINGSNYAYGASQPYRPLDGYVIVQGGSTPEEVGGNLMIGTLQQSKNIDFVLGGVESGNVVGQFIYDTGFKLNKKPLIFSDGTSQNTAGKSAIFTQLAFDLANTNASDIVAIKDVNVSQNNRINSAFSVANSALANTTGTFAGDLTFTGNVIAKGLSTTGGLVSIIDSTFPAGNAAVEIIGSSSGVQQIPANDGYMLHITGKDSIPTRVIVDSFGANSYSLYSGRSGRGTAATPLATANGDTIARFSSSSYDGTSFPLLGVGRMDFVATENHTSSNKGTEMQIWTINNGSNTLMKTASFNGSTATFPNDIHANNILLTGSLTANTLAGQVFFANITIGSSTANTIQFYPLYTPPVQVDGQIWYSGNSISLIADTDITGDRPQVGKVLYERVYNSTGTSIAAASWVRLSGQTTPNSVPYIALASATSAANSVVAGFVKNSIANGAYGFVYTRGLVDLLDMSSFGNGELLFLSTTPGQASNNAPIGSTLSTIEVAKVLSNSATTGKLQIEITPRPEYGKANGAVKYANNNISVASNTVIINEPAGTLNVANAIYISGNVVPTQVTNTWTPTLTFSTQGTQTYSLRVGNYIKTGNKVFASFAITLTAQSGTGNMSLTLTGLPTPLTTTGSAGIVRFSTQSGLVGSIVDIAGSVASASNIVPIFGNIIVSGGGGSVTSRQLAGGDFGATTTITGIVEYITA